MEAITIILLFFYFVRQCKLASTKINEDLQNEAIEIAETGINKVTKNNMPDVDELLIKKWAKIGYVTIRTILAMLSIASIIYVMQLN